MKQSTFSISILIILLTTLSIVSADERGYQYNFTSLGSVSWNSGNATSVNVEVWGGGGGGSGTIDNSAQGTDGGGGGGYSRSTLTVLPGSSYTVFVGGGGLGGTLTSNGGDGNDSYFNSTSTVLAKGGKGGYWGGGGNGTQSQGGQASSGIGTTKYSGGNGGLGTFGGSGGGGGGAGNNSNGTSGGSGSSCCSNGGAGGTTFGGSGGNGVNTDNNGNNGSTIGGGGSGAYCDAACAAKTGGNGVRGEVRITVLTTTTTFSITATNNRTSASVNVFNATITYTPNPTSPTINTAWWDDFESYESNYNLERNTYIPQTNNITSYYPFDTCTTNDYTGRNNGTITGGVTCQRGIISNASYLFDGASSTKISTGTFNNTNLSQGYTIGAWYSWNAVEPIGTGERDIIRLRRTPTGYPYTTLTLRNNTGTVRNYLRLQMNSSGCDFTAVAFNNNFQNGTPHLAVGVYNTTDLLVYIDGIFIANQALSASCISLLASFNSSALYHYGIGNSPLSGSAFNGTIDSPFYYNSIFSSSDVSKLYNLSNFTYRPQGGGSAYNVTAGIVSVGNYGSGSVGNRGLMCGLGGGVCQVTKSISYAVTPTISYDVPYGTANVTYSSGTLYINISDGGVLDNLRAFINNTNITVNSNLYCPSLRRDSSDTILSCNVYENNTIKYNLTDGLVAYYPMDEGWYGNDSTGKYNATTINATTTSGIVGTGAYSFNGSGYISIDSNIVNLSNNFSVSMFVYMNSIKIDQKAISITNNGKRFTIEHVSSGNILRAGVYNGSTYKSKSSTSFLTITPYHLVFSWDANTETSTFYMNGVSLSGTSSNSGSGTVGAYIGARTDTLLSWNGSIDDVRIYNRSLSADEIFALYSFGFPGGIVNGSNSGFGNVTDVSLQSVRENTSLTPLYSNLTSLSIRSPFTLFYSTTNGTISTTLNNTLPVLVNIVVGNTTGYIPYTSTNYNVSVNLPSILNPWPVLKLYSAYTGQELTKSLYGAWSTYINGVLSTNNFGSGDTLPLSDLSLYNLTAQNVSWYNTTSNNNSPYNDLNMSVVQSIVGFTATEIITNASINSFTVTPPNSTHANTSTNPSLYLDAGTYNIVWNKTGWYNTTSSVTATPATTSIYNFYNVYAYQANITAYNYLTNASITNFSVTISSNEYPYTINYTTTNGTIYAPLTNGTYNLTYFGSSILTTYHNFTINNTGSTLINKSVYVNPSVIYVHIYDENTNSLILSAINVTVSGSIGDTTNTTNNGLLYIGNLTPDTYSVKISGGNYSLRTYTVTLGSDQLVNVYAYLPPSAQATTFDILDATTGATIQGLNVVAQRSINGTFTTVDSAVSDVAGNVQFNYISGVRYQFIISGTSTTNTTYVTNTFILDPILYNTNTNPTGYQVKMTPSNAYTNAGDYDQIQIYYTPQIYYDNQQNNFSITFLSPTGTFINYTYTVSAPGVSGSGSGNNVQGGNFYNTLNITGATFIDTVNLTYTYTTTTSATTKTFRINFPIIVNSTTPNTIASMCNTNYGFGDLEKAGITTLGAAVLGGAGKIAGGNAGAGIMILLSLFAAYKMCIINLWGVALALLTGIVLFIVGDEFL